MTHIEARRELKKISSKDKFDKLLSSSTLSTEEKEILYEIYIEKKPFGYIGDKFGYSEYRVKTKHREILSVLSVLLEEG